MDRKILAWALIIVGLASIAGAVIIGAGACATTMAASALLHVPTCEQTTAGFLMLTLLTIVCFGVGGVLLVKSRRGALKRVAVESPMPSPSAMRFCDQCGRQVPFASLFCNQCGARLV